MGSIFFTILLNSEHIITKKSMVYLSDLYCFSMYNIEYSRYLIITILSMAGLPPLGGFIGKLLLYLSVIESRLDIIILISLVISIISVYYYLSFVRYILFEKIYNFKLYYFVKKNCFSIILSILSLSLVFFVIYLPILFNIMTFISLSCMYPFIFY